MTQTFEIKLVVTLLCDGDRAACECMVNMMIENQHIPRSSWTAGPCGSSDLTVNKIERLEDHNKRITCES